MHAAVHPAPFVDSDLQEVAKLILYFLQLFVGAFLEHHITVDDAIARGHAGPHCMVDLCAIHCETCAMQWRFNEVRSCDEVRTFLDHLAED